MPTTISWTGDTWNPTTGCDRVSPGCDRCYALTLAKRLKAMGLAKYQNDGNPETSGPGFLATQHPDTLDVPLHWTKPRRVFVNSMSDLFHNAFTDEFIAKVFAVMAATPQHTYQILTKRHARMRSLLSSEDFRKLTKTVHAEMQLNKVLPYKPLVINVWPLRNVWLGVSVEDQKWADRRIPALLDTPAAVRWMSAEPLLGPLDIAEYLDGECMGSGEVGNEDLTCSECSGEGQVARLDWIVVGGESGHTPRPMSLDWARQIRDDALAAGVPFHFKQTGTITAKQLGLTGKGDRWDELPSDLKIREYPRLVST